MKFKNIFILLFLLISTASFAQRKEVRLNFGFHGTLPDNEGFGLHLMPKWNISDRVALGFNMQADFFILEVVDVGVASTPIMSFSPTVFYYWKKSKIRPFVGLGVGVYKYSIGLKNKFGAKPVIGISFSEVFNLSVEQTNLFGNTPWVFKDKFTSIKASFSIGIARTKK